MHAPFVRKIDCEMVRKIVSPFVAIEKTGVYIRIWTKATNWRIVKPALCSRVRASPRRNFSLFSFVINTFYRGKIPLLRPIPKVIELQRSWDKNSFDPWYQGDQKTIMLLKCHRRTPMYTRIMPLHSNIMSVRVWVSNILAILMSTHLYTNENH